MILRKQLKEIRYIKNMAARGIAVRGQDFFKSFSSETTHQNFNHWLKW